MNSPGNDVSKKSASDAEDEGVETDSWLALEAYRQGSEITGASTSASGEKFEELTTEDYSRRPSYSIRDDDDFSGHARQVSSTEFEYIESSSKHKTFVHASDYVSGSFRRSSPQSRLSRVQIAQAASFGRTEALGFDGIATVNLSPLTQNIVGCEVGKDVTIENPWTFVKKETIEDNIDLRVESSDFLPIKDQILEFHDTELLIGYAPSMRREEKFYICVTKSATRTVLRSLEAYRGQQKDRARNALCRTAGTWTSFGSESEVGDTIFIGKNGRPRLETEIEIPESSLNLSIKLEDRVASDQSDGYVDLVPYGQKFHNVTMKLVDRADQAKPVTRDSETLTSYLISGNAWTQFDYVYPAMNPKLLEGDRETAIKKFLDNYTNYLCDQIIINSTWDIYTDDVANLARRAGKTVRSEVYTKNQTAYNGKRYEDRVVSSLSWHPFRSDIAAVVFYDRTDTLSYQKTSEHETMPNFHGINHISVWSMTNRVSPKLVLSSPKEVTTISFCPLDGNVIIGGCINGQVAIWDITGKIEQAETAGSCTGTQPEYETTMHNLTSRMKEKDVFPPLRPAAMCCLRRKQSGAIVEIAWVPVYNKVDKNGRISILPRDISISELTRQFLTASEDGTIACWDLGAPPDTTEDEATLTPQRQHPRLHPSPSNVSIYSILDGVFKPNYKICVRLPKAVITVTLTCMSLYFPEFGLVRVENDSDSGNDATKRSYVQSDNILLKSDHHMETYILLGSADGDLLRVQWIQQKSSTKITIEERTMEIIGRYKTHDGPVTSIIRSKYSKRILITIGGRVFALWKDDEMIPIFWRKSNAQYTSCCWAGVRPTVFLMGRNDSIIEIWDLQTTNQVPIFTQCFSAGPIINLVTPKVPKGAPCFAFFYHNGTFKVFRAPETMNDFDAADVKWLGDFCHREIDRIGAIEPRQSQLIANDTQKIERDEFPPRTDGEEENKLSLPMDEIREEIREHDENLPGSRSKIHKPKDFLKRAEERWKAMELRRMEQVILGKDGLGKDELEKRCAPLIRAKEAANRKTKRFRQILQQREMIFQDAIAPLFPNETDEERISELEQLAKRLEEVQPTTDFTNLLE